MEELHGEHLGEHGRWTEKYNFLRHSPHGAGGRWRSCRWDLELYGRMNEMSSGRRRADAGVEACHPAVAVLVNRTISIDSGSEVIGVCQVAGTVPFRQALSQSMDLPAVRRGSAVYGCRDKRSWVWQQQRHPLTSIDLSPSDH